LIDRPGPQTPEVVSMQSSSPSSSSYRVAQRSARRPAHDPPRVLVAEDDREMLETLVEILETQGYDVQEATDGGRLLVALTNSARCGYEDGVDLLISDICMPVCSGLQIVEGLRAAHCAVPVILITGLIDERTRFQAARLDAVLLQKPFALDALTRAVTQLLARREGVQ
jgi:DNA-binding response OmpR family regulator